MVYKQTLLLLCNHYKSIWLKTLTLELFYLKYLSFSEADLHGFTHAGYNIKTAQSRWAITGIAVDDCASACLSEQFFDCDAFDYCYNTGDCFLFDSWVVDHADFDNSSTCDLFRRKLWP